MQYFWIFWQDMVSRPCGNYLGIYGAIKIGVASQSSTKGNIPFIGKGIYGLNKNVAWIGWIHGMTWERLGFKVHLSMERKYAQVSSPKRCSKSNPIENPEISQKSFGKESSKIQDVTQGST